MNALKSVLLFFAIITIACLLSALAWHFPKFALTIALIFFVGTALSAWYLIVEGWYSEDRELD